MDMERVISVTLFDRHIAKVDIAKCTTWRERYRSDGTVGTRRFLHRAPNGYWILELQDKHDPGKSWARQIPISQAVEWLIFHQWKVPEDRGLVDRRVDLLELSPPQPSANVVNYCLNCLSQKPGVRRHFARYKRVLDAMGKSTLHAKTIAQRLGLKCNSNFRTLLAEMVRFGLLEKARGKAGYRAATHLS
jgi:hypothetical protein